MHKGLLFSIALTGLLAGACGDSTPEASRKDGFSQKPQSKEDSLYHLVMEGHDVGMAKTSRVKQYLIRAQHELDSLYKLPAAKQDEVYQQALMDIQEQLNYANYGMDTWMDEFKADSAKGNEELRLKYLQSELEKVTIVKKQILEGLQAADSLFKKP